MTVEILAALVVIALGVVQVTLQAIEYRRVHGVPYANSAQDTPSPVADSPLLGRLTRALRNLHETLPFFLGVVIILALMQVSTPGTRTAAMTFAAARIVYLPLYALGVPYLRGLVWTISFGALISLLVAAFSAADWSVLG
ncbi:MAPEG family protein [Parapedomonas caeni]